MTTGGTALSYNTRGALAADATSGASASYGYDSENRLTSVGGDHAAVLGYNALGQLSTAAASATAAATVFRYDGSNLLTEQLGTGVPDRTYVWGEGGEGPLLSVQPTANQPLRVWDYADERGSIMAVLPEGASAPYVNSFDEYGIPAAGNTGRFQYTGQAWIPEAGLYHYKARAYSPTLGRFLQPDPAGYDAGMNLYGYVGGDPVNFTDPLGLAVCGGPTTSIRPDGKAGTVGTLNITLGGPCIPTLGDIVRNGSSGGSREGGASSKGSLPPPPPPPQDNNKICNRRLPGGRTIRQNVAEINRLLDSLLQAPDPSGASFALFGYWLGKVSPGGEWAGGLGEPGGNRNYGATGRAAGIPLTVLLRGAGAAEKLESLTGRTGSDSTGQGSPFGGPPYGDNPEGQEQIRQGYDAQCN